MEEVDNDVSSLREEYIQLQDHLADIELKYQSAIADGQGGTFGSKLQILVAELFNKPLYSDVVIVLAGELRLFGHKLILTARSNCWCDNTDLNGVQELNLTDIKYDVSYAVIKWVYTDEIEIQPDDDIFIELLRVARRFQLESLNIRCQKAMISCITPDNCSKFYHISDELSCELLKDYCTEFISQCKEIKIEIDDQDYERFDSGEIVDKQQDVNKMIKSIGTGQGKIATKQHQCSQCHMIFSKLQYLRRHMKTHNGSRRFKCDVCDKSFARVDTCNTHMKTHTDVKPFICHICGSNFRQDSHLKTHHLLKHTELRPHQCDTCGKLYKLKGDLQKHVMQHHNGGMRDFKCFICEKTFATKATLRTHTKIHQGAGMKRTNSQSLSLFQCKTCDKFVQSRRSLEDHNRIHSGQKPYTCSVCSKSFSQESSLKNHLNIHKKVRPYVCEICSRAFNSKGNLKIHSKTHYEKNPFKCDLCEKGFSGPGNLKRHKAEIHNGQKTFLCNHCGRSFSQKVTLQNHEKTHCDILLVQCDICDEVFSDKLSFDMHNTQIHKNESSIHENISHSGSEFTVLELAQSGAELTHSEAQLITEVIQCVEDEN